MSNPTKRLTFNEFLKEELQDEEFREELQKSRAATLKQARRDFAQLVQFEKCECGKPVGASGFCEEGEGDEEAAYFASFNEVTGEDLEFLNKNGYFDKD